MRYSWLASIKIRLHGKTEKWIDFERVDVSSSSIVVIEWKVPTKAYRTTKLCNSKSSRNCYKSVSFIEAIFFNDNSAVLRSFRDCFLNAVFQRRPGCAANFTIAPKESYFLVDRSENKKRKASFRGKHAFD